MIDDDRIGVDQSRLQPAEPEPSSTWTSDRCNTDIGMMSEMIAWLAMGFLMLIVVVM
jgi:hypothetical protein